MSGTQGFGWRKSSHSGQENCLVVRPAAGGVEVRDSKNPGGAVLAFTRDEWLAFVAGAKAGEFDFST
jgi:hypothetical protein